MYIGVNNAAREIKNAYVGVDGVSRQIKAIYVGVNGVARLVWKFAKHIYTKFTSYHLATKSNSHFINSVSGSGWASASALWVEPVPSEREGNAFYHVVDSSMQLVSDNSSDYYTYLTKATLDENGNIENFKKVAVGSGYSWTDYSGNYGYNKHTPVDAVEMGKDLVMYFYRRDYQSSSESSKTPGYTIVDMNTETILYDKYDNTLEVNNAVCFSDNVVVTAAKNYNAILTLIRFNGEATTEQQYRIRLNGYDATIIDNNPCRVVKLDDHKGFFISKLYVWAYREGVEISGTYICPFTLSADYSSINLGTPVKAPTISYHTVGVNGTFGYNKNCAISVSTSQTNSNDSYYKDVYIDFIMIDDNLNVTFNYAYRSEYNQIYSGMSKAIQLGKSNVLLMSCGRKDYGFYKFTIGEDYSVTYDGEIEPKTNNINNDDVKYKSGLRTSLFNGQVVNAGAYADTYVANTYKHDIYCHTLVMIFK